MNRRHALTAIAGSAATIPLIANRLHADEPSPILPNTFAVSPNQEFRLALRSTPVVLEHTKLSLVSLGTGRLTLDDAGRLKARIRAAITQYAKIDYWISLAVFDKQHTFLGAATHKEAIQYIRLGSMPTTLQELEFDFGISNTYKSVAHLAVAISDRDVPKPNQG